MRVRLFHKLFCVIVIACFAAIVLFGVTTHAYMQRNFLRFINEEREQHLAMLAGDLVEHYREHGDWRAFSERRTWRRFVGNSVSTDTTPQRTEPRAARHRRRPRITLYDADHSPIGGRTPFTQITHALPIEVGGAVVGWIGVPPFERRPTPREARFERNQLQVLLIAAVVACLLSVVIAWFTARRLAAPISAVSRAARDLGSGKFDVRVAVPGSDEIGQLAKDFNLLATTLDHNESARRRWFADVSHELRTPLAILRGEIEAVRDGVRPNDDRLIESLDQETQRLNQLVEDLYDLARADIGALGYEFEPCEVASLVDAVLQRFAHRFEQAGLDVEQDLETGLELLADRHRLSQLVENLLENCCRYVRTPGRLRIRLRRVDRAAELCVEDSGPGVEPADLEALFDPLTRVEQSRAREHSGSGLGLAICKRIAQAHGGDIVARSATLGGLAVVVTLPLAKHA